MQRQTLLKIKMFREIKMIEKTTESVECPNVFGILKFSIFVGALHHNIPPTPLNVLEICKS